MLTRKIQVLFAALSFTFALSACVGSEVDSEIEEESDENIGETQQGLWKEGDVIGCLDSCSDSKWSCRATCKSTVCHDLCSDVYWTCNDACWSMQGP